MILDAATDLCERYSDSIPIVDRGSQRLKIARLAASLAARTFSTDDGESLMVRKCHVEYVLDMLKKLYDGKALGYKDFTQAIKITSQMSDADEVKASIASSPYPKDLVQCLLTAPTLDLQVLQDATGYDRGAAQELLSLLVRKRALLREKRVYRKAGSFTDLLKAMLAKDDFLEVPDYLNEVRF